MSGSKLQISQKDSDWGFLILQIKMNGDMQEMLFPSPPPLPNCIISLLALVQQWLILAWPGFGWTGRHIIKAIIINLNDIIIHPLTELQKQMNSEQPPSRSLSVQLLFSGEGHDAQGVGMGFNNRIWLQADFRFRL